MINKYKTDHEFLIFGENINFPEDLNITLIEENADLNTNKDLPIYNYNDLFLTLLNPKLRTTDKLLIENGILTFHNIKDAYFLIRYKACPLTKRVRDLVVKKYTTILDHVLPDKTKN